MKLRHFLSVLLICALLAPAGVGRAAGLQAGEMLSDPAQEVRAQEIGKQLRCLVCQNQSILDSNAALARDLRNIVRERIVAGDDNSEVLDYVVARYGDFVLLKPPVKPATFILWLAPVFFVLIALASAGLYYRGQRRADGGPEKFTREDRREARRLLKGEP